MNVNKSRDHILQEAIRLLKSNIISPSDSENLLNWTKRAGPWGKAIKNLLLPPEAGDFVTPNKNTFVGQWYWDTMGTNIGLLRSGDDHLRKVALSMVENLFFLYDKTGLIPNAADSVQVTRSQPPFLSSMCLDVGEYFFENNSEEKIKWFEKSYEYCKKEVMIPWEVHSSECGFQWFDKIRELHPGHSPEETLEYFRPESRSDYRVMRSLVFKTLSIDLGERKPLEYKKIIPLLLEAFSMLSPEQRKALTNWLYTRRLLVASGMDFTASYGVKAMPDHLKEILEPEMLLRSDLVYSDIENISPIDLNCLIYKYYDDLLQITELLAVSLEVNNSRYYTGEQEIWRYRKARLKEQINNTHFSEKDLCFHNFNIPNSEKLTDLHHLTQFAYPLFVKLADEKTSRILAGKIMDLTTNYGVKLTQEKTGFQWDFNMWPLQTWLAVQGLINYGFEKEACKISEGYIRCVEKVFHEKGSFYEKYNAESGGIDTDGRYPAEQGFSWGAAVYIGLNSGRRS